MVKRAIFDKKNILVTGGAGFLGSHLCDELVKNNKIICIDNFSTGDEKNIDHLLANENFEFINHDITLPISLEALPELKKFKIEFQGIQEIYHLACPTSPKNFLKNRIATLDTLSLGTKNILEMARKFNAKVMDFSSSVVYGPRMEGSVKMDETNLGLVDFLSDRGSYDEGKKFTETYFYNYRKVYNIDAKIVRLFRIFGPKMKLNDGQMIPDFIDAALDNRDIVIYGDKNFSSSFCYVSDCVNAVIRFMETDMPGPLNIGSDIDINITDIAEKIISILGSKSKVVYEKENLFMTSLRLPDISRARQDLGWMPIVVLEQGLEKTIDDLRANKGLKNIDYSKV